MTRDLTQMIEEAKRTLAQAQVNIETSREQLRLMRAFLDTYRNKSNDMDVFS